MNDYLVIAHLTNKISFLTVQSLSSLLGKSRIKFYKLDVRCPSRWVKWPLLCDGYYLQLLEQFSSPSNRHLYPCA